jgi:hypothetical protein
MFKGMLHEQAKGELSFHVPTRQRGYKLGKEN